MCLGLLMFQFQFPYQSFAVLSHPRQSVVKRSDVFVPLVSFVLAVLVVRVVLCRCIVFVYQNFRLFWEYVTVLNVFGRF